MGLVLLHALLAWQIAAPNSAGMSMGHIHLNVSDVEAQKKFWIEQFDARLVTTPGVEGVMVPGMLILFNHKAPAHASETTVLDHFGFKVRSRDEMVRNCRAAGLVVPREFKGSEGFPNAYVTGPDGLKVEMQEESSLTVRAVAQHLHFLLPDDFALRAWYVKTFSMEETTRGPHESADIPGMNLTFAASGKAHLEHGTAGGIIDHIGFEVVNLTAIRDKLLAAGIDVGTIREGVAAPGTRSAFLTDPVGTQIELTEGLSSAVK